MFLSLATEWFAMSGPEDLVESYIDITSLVES